MGDAYSDGSLWFRSLRDKLDKLQELVEEIIIEEPHLGSIIKQRVDEGLKKKPYIINSKKEGNNEK